MPGPLFPALCPLQATSPLCWGSAVSCLADWAPGSWEPPLLQAALAALPVKPQTPTPTLVNLPSPHAVFHPKKSAANFTSQDIYKAMQEGQRAVWAKLPAIQVRGGTAHRAVH